MPLSVTRKADGSIAFFIDGDLQFDSKDERIYHEGLAVPALALATGRNGAPVSALIIGGGDGLTARELFKSECIERVDLVDYDADVVALARSEFSTLNALSMSDERLSVHVRDAWQFVEDAVRDRATYDLIVSDLTVATDSGSARFHSIDWYERLLIMLGSQGVLAVNGVSPMATPRAFWSIFNGLIASGLHPRPYRVSIPSFSTLGYGEDWGFFLASPKPILPEELDDFLPMAEPRYILNDAQSVRNMFLLPDGLFEHQPQAQPARAGSEILLHYFYNSVPVSNTTGLCRDCLTFDFGSLPILEADDGTSVLPAGVRDALAQCIRREQVESAGENAQRQSLTDQVLDLMPALKEFHTPEIVSDFVNDPAAFLQAIDIQGLVSHLLGRAAELPSRMVSELQMLHEKLLEWTGDYESLLVVGQRVLAILTLVVVVGNLLYPDSVYAKGGHAAAAHTGHYAFGNRDNGGRSFGNRGRGYGGYRGYWGSNWGTWGWSRPWHSFYWGGYAPPAYYGTSYWNNYNPRPNEYVNETGNTYPVRTYSCGPVVQNYGTVAAVPPHAAAPNAVNVNQAAYRLSDGADVLSDGRTAIPLTEQAYLMVTPQATNLVDHATGAVILSLANDPALIYQTATEMRRQRHRLMNEIEEQSGSAPSNSALPTVVAGTTEASSPPNKLAAMHAKADLLQKALGQLGPIPEGRTDENAAPLVPGGTELFANCWMTPDGKYLAIKRASGKIAYLDGKGWYSDFGKTKLRTPYPENFKPVATAFLSKLVKESDSTSKMLQQDKNEGSAHLDMLNRELSDYQSATGKPDDLVTYGTRQMKRAEATRLTQLAIKRTSRKLDEIQKQLDGVPAETSLAQKELASLG